MRAELAACLILFLPVPAALADGSSIGKVYQPYVQPLEKEVEYRVIHEDENSAIGTTRTRHQLALGGSVSERWYLEGVVSYQDKPAPDIADYELEAIWQLTEQGEYSSDWGLMLELEKQESASAWEGAIGLLNTREWRRWQVTTNLFLIREWGGDVKSEFETALAFQARYRYQRSLEPGLELFMGEDTRAIGPTIGGQLRLATTNKLFWQVAALFGTIEETPDTTLKLELEYEFF